MKIDRLKIKFVPLLLVLCLCSEASAVRPPLKPLDMDNLNKMVAEADVIAVGTVSSETRSKTVHKPRETIAIQAVISVDRIIKGDTSIKTITIDESYQQFSSNDALADKGITASTTGPPPPVGIYRKGERIFAFLKSISNSGLFRPVGSGNYDAYIGLFEITSHGITSDRYTLDDAIATYSGNEDGFVSLISRIALHSFTGQQSN